MYIANDMLYKMLFVNKYFFFSFVPSVKVAALSHSTVEQELFPLATHASECLDRLYPSGRLLEVGHQHLCDL